DRRSHDRQGRTTNPYRVRRRAPRPAGAVRNRRNAAAEVHRAAPYVAGTLRCRRGFAAADDRLDARTARGRAPGEAVTAWKSHGRGTPVLRMSFKGIGQ